MVGLDEYVDGQKILIERQKQVIREKQVVLEDKHGELVAASRDYKIIEKLKDKRLQAFKKKLALKEMKELDDLVTMQAGREKRA